MRKFLVDRLRSSNTVRQLKKDLINIKDELDGASLADDKVGDANHWMKISQQERELLKTYLSGKGYRNQVVLWKQMKRP